MPVGSLRLGVPPPAKPQPIPAIPLSPAALPAHPVDAGSSRAHGPTAKKSAGSKDARQDKPSAVTPRIKVLVCDGYTE